MPRKSAWFVFAAALLTALPLRLYQVLFLIDPDTGFFRDGSRSSGLITLVLAGGIVLIFLLCMGSRGEAAGPYRPVRSVFAAVSGALAGLTFLLGSVLDLAGFGAEQNHFMYMLLSLAGILTGIVFLLSAYDFAAGRNRFARRPLLALIPSVWGCFCLISLFVAYVAVVNVSENVCETFSAIFLLLFLFWQAKLLSGVENEKSGNRVFLFGLPAVMLLLVTGVPGVVSVLSGVSHAQTAPRSLYFIDTALAVYLFAFLTALYRAQSGNGQILSAPPVPMERPAGPENGERKEENGVSECLSFLARAYRSEERFLERAPSPFLPGTGGKSVKNVSNSLPNDSLCYKIEHGKQ